MTINTNDKQLIDRNWEKILERASDALDTPSDSYWFDKDLWNSHTLVLSTPDINLTDDYLADWSNYRSVLRELSEQFPDDVEDATFGHWTYSKFYAVKIRVIDDKGEITEAFAELSGILDKLEDYPIFDEQDYYELEEEVRTTHLTDLANDYQCNLEGLVDAMEKLDVYYTPGHGFDLYKVTEEQLIEKARELSNTFDQHVGSGPHHYPEHCYYCARAIEGIPA